MPQTIALQVQNPQIDVPGAMLNAQRFQAGQQDMAANDVTNKLNAAKATDEEAQLGALANYRQAAGAGDPNALATLKAYPELQQKFHDALDAMKPDQQKAALDRGMKIAEAAQRVAAIPVDSPARKTAWNAELDGLKKAGAIDQSHYDAYYNNPSDLVIDQALSLGQSVKDFTAARQKAAGTNTDGLTSKDLLDVETATNNFAKTYFGTNNQEFLTDAQVKERDGKVAEYRTNLIAQIKASKPTGATGATAAAPAAPAAPAQAPALNANAGAVDRGNPSLIPRNVGALNSSLSPQPAQPVTSVTSVTPPGAAAPAAPKVPPGGALAAPTPQPVVRPSTPATSAGQQAPATVKDWKPGMPPPVTHAGAVKIQNRAQLEALPPGTPVILPDGTPTYRK